MAWCSVNIETMSFSFIYVGLLFCHFFFYFLCTLSEGKNGVLAEMWVEGREGSDAFGCYFNGVTIGNMLMSRQYRLEEGEADLCKCMQMC